MAMEADELSERFWKRRRKDGTPGVGNLGDYFQALSDDYTSVERFLADNPAAVEVLIDFVEHWLEKDPSWEEHLRAVLRETGEIKEDD